VSLHYRRCRAYLHHRGIKVRVARRGIEDKSKLGRVYWVIERTISWLLRFKRLGLRYDRTERTTLPLLTLACTIINVRRLIKSAQTADHRRGRTGVRAGRVRPGPDHTLALRQVVEFMLVRGGVGAAQVVEAQPAVVLARDVFHGR
jgi:hypothetical protein